ncbi:MAG: DUF4143 domain-containing protein [Acidimicrobiales bacterium]
MRGGFPIALSRRSDDARDRWFDDYVFTVLERDVTGLAQLRQRDQLPGLLRHLASRTGQLLNVAAAAAAAGLDRGTAAGYLALLEAVFLVRELPAWGTTLHRRAVAAPKLHVVDSGLAARLLGLSAVPKSVSSVTLEESRLRSHPLPGGGDSLVRPGWPVPS